MVSGTYGARHARRILRCHRFDTCREHADSGQIDSGPTTFTSSANSSSLHHASAQEATLFVDKVIQCDERDAMRMNVAHGTKSGEVLDREESQEALLVI